MFFLHIGVQIVQSALTYLLTYILTYLLTYLLH